ncbi:MAG: nucleotidyltransferase family protein [Bacteroidota bacterium]|nr:nucleotidyltransferase family protein [Bacteroidota bacterium]
MGIREAIILAGGLGTRLRTAVPDLPKCMAPVNGKPFLTFVIDHLQSQGIEHFVFCLGYKSEVIVDFLCKSYPSLCFKTSIEDEPLGTGGAVKKACKIAKDKCVLVANGDTLFKIDVEVLAGVHCLTGASCTVALKPMKNSDRYGVVELDNHCLIKSFKEKQFYESSLINGGVYGIHTHKFLDENLPEKFSLETDYLEKYYNKRRMFGVVQDQYFIDIGIPEDFERAQVELKE